MSDLKRLGANIRYLRKAHGETQEDLVFALGNIGKGGDFLSNSAISNYEKGIREPEEAILTAIARHFMITVDELIHKDYSDIQSVCFDNKVFLKKIDIILPIIYTEEALKNEAFNKAYELHKQFYKYIQKEKIDYLKLFNESLHYYDLAKQDDNCFLLCAGNTIALWYLFLLMLKIPSVMSGGPASILQITKNDSKSRKIVDSLEPNFEKKTESATFEYII